MTVKPILFSAPMVRALIEGRKTQTRRILKPQPPEDSGAMHGPEMYYPAYIDKRTGEMDAGPAIWGVYTEEWGTKVPYQPGDLLYVRETWWHVVAGDGATVTAPGSSLGRDAAFFVADYPDYPPCPHYRKRPGIHMPRRFSRLTLEVTGVKVERLKSISEADALAEGTMPPGTGGDPRAWFAQTWEDIHSLKSWLENPWVIAVTFKTHQINVDAYLAQHKDRAA